jgi:hypothetical protein
MRGTRSRGQLPSAAVPQRIRSRAAFSRSLNAGRAPGRWTGPSRTLADAPEAAGHDDVAMQQPTRAGALRYALRGASAFPTTSACSMSKRKRSRNSASASAAISGRGMHGERRRGDQPHLAVAFKADVLRKATSPEPAPCCRNVTKEGPNTPSMTRAGRSTLPSPALTPIQALRPCNGHGRVANLLPTDPAAHCLITMLTIGFLASQSARLRECASSRRRNIGATRPQSMGKAQSMAELIAIQTFNSSGVFNPAFGTTRVIVEVQGAGGGGGGTAATGATTGAASGGGGAGA